MVISEKHKFIFLRVPKNASTSLATWFVNNCCDENDRYTGIGDSRIKTHNIDQRVIEENKHHHHFIHLTLQELVDFDIIKRSELNDKKVIMVFRDPLERQLSLFFFKGAKHGEKSIENFRETFKNGCHADDRNNEILQCEYPLIDGEYPPKMEVWFHSELDWYLKNFIEDNDIEETHPLNKFKSNRKPRAEYHRLIEEYYDEKTMNAVREYYKDDYSFYYDMRATEYASGFDH